MAPQSRFLITAFLGIAGLAGVGGAFIWRQATAPVEHASPELATGAFVAPHRTLPDFSLIDHHGKAFGNAQLRGHWSLLFFGYTNCPDLCPATLTMLAALQKRLHADGVPQRPQVLFLSVDTRRDTPAQLAAYVPNFDPEFIGLTAADQPALQAVAAGLGAAVILTPQGAAYSVDHSGAIFVLDPKGRLSAVLTGPYTVDGLQADFRRIVAARG